MSKLLPWLKLEMAPLNIEDLDLEIVPEKPGVYVMLSNRVEYTYPWSESKNWSESKTGNGKSKVYYIGQSANLRDRIGRHKKNLEEVISKYDESALYWSRYEYGLNHGCRVVWLVSKNPKDKEKELLRDFAFYYGAKPVANG